MYIFFLSQAYAYIVQLKHVLCFGTLTHERI